MACCAPGVHGLPFFAPGGAGGGSGGFIPPAAFGPLGAPLVSGGPGVQSFWGSRAVFAESVSPVLTLTPATGLQEGLHVTQVMTGDGPSPTGLVRANQFDVVSDQVRLGTDGNNIFSALLITHNFGGGNTSGARETFNVISQMTAPSLITNPNPQYAASTIEMQAATSDNNVGGFFGFNPRCLAAPGLGVLNEITGYETDIVVAAGTAPVRKFGGNVYSLNGDVSHGTTWDAAYGVGATGTGAGWLNGLLAHFAGGVAPIAATGALVATQGSYVIDRGIDLSSLSSVTTAILRGPGSAFLIEGDGDIRQPNARFIRWRNAANSADINDVGTNSSNQLTLVSTGALVINGVAAGIVTVGPITPLIDATYDLGSSGARYANGFFSSVVRVPTVAGGAANGSTLLLLSTVSGTPAGDSTTVQGTTVILRGFSGAGTTVNLGVAGVTGATMSMAGASSGAQTFRPAAAASGDIRFPAGTVDFSATGGSNQVVKQTSAGGIFTVGQVTFAELANQISVAQMGNTTYAPNAIAFRFVGVNFNSANTDFSIPISLPNGFTRYVVATVSISNASQTLTAATAGLFTAAAGGGTAIVAGGSAITVSTAANDTNNNHQFMNLFANNNTTAWSTATVPTLFWRVATAQGAAATGDVTVTVRVIS